MPLFEMGPCTGGGPATHTGTCPSSRPHHLAANGEGKGALIASLLRDVELRQTKLLMFLQFTPGSGVKSETGTPGYLGTLLRAGSFHELGRRDKAGAGYNISQFQGGFTSESPETGFG